MWSLSLLIFGGDKTNGVNNDTINVIHHILGCLKMQVDRAGHFSTPSCITLW